MKNYIIGLLAVCILVLGSFLYKKETMTVDRYGNFPMEGNVDQGEDAPLFLYVFMSKTNCRDCLGVVEVLNTLPSQFVVIGVVPEHELKDEKEIRGITGAAFPLTGAAKFIEHLPRYSPAIVGVSTKGDVFFTLPGVPGEKEYLEHFLLSLYKKLYPYLLQEKSIE